MTQPTQAQIEAAAKAMSEKRPVTYTQMAIVALTAAAQVGEPLTWGDRLRAERDVTFLTTIERCAQVADMQARSSNWQVADAAEAIADAIRKLRDAP